MKIFEFWHTKHLEIDACLFGAGRGKVACPFGTGLWQGMLFSGHGERLQRMTKNCSHFGMRPYKVMCLDRIRTDFPSLADRFCKFP
jgi:hypothetical protein